MMNSKDKFFFVSKPKKLHDWLTQLDAAHQMKFYGQVESTSMYRFKQKLNSKHVKKWKASWSELGIDGYDIKLSATEFVIELET